MFGKDAVDEAQAQVAEVLTGWGYRLGRRSDHRVVTVVCQALLLNRSPLLKDLTTDVFDQLRLGAGMHQWHVGTLFGIQRAVAALGFCDQPSFSVHGSMPAIEGTSGTWADWVERWYGTSTLTRRSAAFSGA